MAESPQFVLPFAEREWVDMERACSILGDVNWKTVVRMAQSGMIDMIDYRPGARKKVRYHSLVEFCNGLRRQWDLPDRRPILSAPYLRHRDRDLLPFPMQETMDRREAMRALGSSHKEIIMQLVREGCFEAYQLMPGSPWRISRPSFERYLREVYYHPRRRADLPAYVKLSI